MWRFLNFFAVGLLAGFLVIYQFSRNRRLEGEIASLKQVVERTHSASELSASTMETDPSASAMSLEESNPRVLLQQQISESRSNALTRAIAQTSDAVVGINVIQVREVRKSVAAVRSAELDDV